MDNIQYDTVAQGPLEHVWICPNCGFTFDATHEDEGGGYSCPACENIALLKGLKAFVNRCVCKDGKAHLQGTMKVNCPRCTWARQLLTQYDTAPKEDKCKHGDSYNKCADCQAEDYVMLMHQMEDK